MLTIGLFLSPPLSMASSHSMEVLQNTKARQFIDEMVAKHDYPRERLRALFAEARFVPELIDRVSKPAEALPWYRYRRIFLKPDRAEAGVDFWHTHRDILAKVEEVYGVPQKIIVAILGVETYFGKRTGKYPVLDSLATLSFRNSLRTKFFRRELEQFLLLTNEERGLDPHALKGSYAGAMGLPQFISSSYRRYAIDFDGDNRRDLIESIPDAVGSAAHYLKEHGWQRDGEIAIPVKVNEKAIRDEFLMKKRGSKPHLNFSVLKEHGVIGSDVAARTGIADDEPVALIKLETENGFVYWIGLRNFYMITHYNHSNLYAMAVLQLAEDIRKRYSQKYHRTYALTDAL